MSPDLEVPLSVKGSLRPPAGPGLGKSLVFREGALQCALEPLRWVRLHRSPWKCVSRPRLSLQIRGNGTSREVAKIESCSETVGDTRRRVSSYPHRILQDSCYRSHVGPGGCSVTSTIDAVLVSLQGQINSPGHLECARILANVFFQTSLERRSNAAGTHGLAHCHLAVPQSIALVLHLDDIMIVGPNAQVPGKTHACQGQDSLMECSGFGALERMEAYLPG